MELTPPGVTAPTATAAQALALLKDRLGIDFTPPFTDPADRRHEIAVLAVELGRRLTDVAGRLVAAIELDDVLVARLLAECRYPVADLSGYEPEARQVQLVPVLAARQSELDRTLRLVAAAYRQAWWSSEETREGAGT